MADFYLPQIDPQRQAQSMAMIVDMLRQAGPIMTGIARQMPVRPPASAYASPADMINARANAATAKAQADFIKAQTDAYTIDAAMKAAQLAADRQNAVMQALDKINFNSLAWAYNPATKSYDENAVRAYLLPEFARLDLLVQGQPNPPAVPLSEQAMQLALGMLRVQPPPTTLSRIHQQFERAHPDVAVFEGPLTYALGAMGLWKGGKYAKKRWWDTRRGKVPPGGTVPPEPPAGPRIILPSEARARPAGPIYLPTGEEVRQSPTGKPRIGTLTRAGKWVPGRLASVVNRFRGRVPGAGGGLAGIIAWLALNELLPRLVAGSDAQRQPLLPLAPIPTRDELLRR